MRLYLFREDTTFAEVVQPVVIGRGHDCDLLLPSGRVSRQHARVTREGDGFFIEDLGTSEGVFQGNHPISKISRQHRIKDGEQFSLGTVLVKAMLRPDELETPLIRAAADEAASQPGDSARREVWTDLLLERGDPLGAWFVSKQAMPSVTSTTGVTLSWSDRLIRTVEVRGAKAGLELLHSRLACHLIELTIDLEDPLEPLAQQLVERLKAMPMPALKSVRLRGMEGPVSLPLAPRLVHLRSS